MKLNILVIDDDLATCMKLKHNLEALGHEVEWIMGAKELPNLAGLIVGLKRVGEPDILINGLAFHLAIVDGHVRGGNNGPDFVRFLVSKGVICAAHSRSGGLNTAMINAGAQFRVNDQPLKNLIDSVCKLLSGEKT